MTIQKSALAASVLTAALLLTGCSQTTTMGGMDHSSGADSESSQSPTDFNAADEMFVTMMIPHHEQAIEMADLVLAKEGVDDRVVALAERIKAAQAPEIETMTGWLRAWGLEPVDSSMGGMEGMDHGDGMMSEDDMTALEAATGADASRLFLEQMIEHHQGAIDMAEPELNVGVNADVKALAAAIVDAQTAEIAEMQQLLTQF